MWSLRQASSGQGLLGWATLRAGGVILRAFQDRMNHKRRMKLMKWREHIKRMHEKEIELALKIDRLKELDRKSVVQGKSVSVRVDLGGRRIMQKKKTIK